jgi:hypothetical protein
VSGKHHDSDMVVLDTIQSSFHTIFPSPRTDMLQSSFQTISPSPRTDMIHSSFQTISLSPRTDIIQSSFHTISPSPRTDVIPSLFHAIAYTTHELIVFESDNCRPPCRLWGFGQHQIDQIEMSGPFDYVCQISLPMARGCERRLLLCLSIAGLRVTFFQCTIHSLSLSLSFGERYT